MPYLKFPAPFYGFYEDYLKTRNVRGVIHLYTKVKPEPTQEIGSDIAYATNDDWIRAAKQADLSKDGFGSYRNNMGTPSNGWKKLATTTMFEPLVMSTNIQWDVGGNLIDALKSGWQKGRLSVIKGVTNIIDLLDQGISGFLHLAGWNEDGSTFVDTRRSNAAQRIARRRIISASAGYKNFAGSDTQLQLPQLEFVFTASDFQGTHVKQARELLLRLLPRIVITDKDPTQAMGSSQEEQGATKVKFSSWMLEEAPNEYVNPATGFNTELIEGTFGLVIDGHQILELVPTGVNLSFSRLKVLCRDDYKEGPIYLDKYYGSKIGDTAVAPTKDQKKKAYIEDVCGDTLPTEINVPLVIRIQATFDFARKVTQGDYDNIFFKFAKSGAKAGNVGRLKGTESWDSYS